MVSEDSPLSSSPRATRLIEAEVYPQPCALYVSFRRRCPPHLIGVLSLVPMVYPSYKYLQWYMPNRSGIYIKKRDLSPAP